MSLTFFDEKKDKEYKMLEKDLKVILFDFCYSLKISELKIYDYKDEEVNWIAWYRDKITFWTGNPYDIESNAKKSIISLDDKIRIAKYVIQKYWI